MSEYRTEYLRRQQNRRKQAITAAEKTAQRRFQTRMRLMGIAIVLIGIALLVIVPMRFRAIAGDDTSAEQQYILENANQDVLKAETTIDAQMATTPQDDFTQMATSLTTAADMTVEMTDKTIAVNTRIITEETASTFGIASLAELESAGETIATRSEMRQVTLYNPISDSLYLIGLIDTLRLTETASMTDVVFLYDGMPIESDSGIIYDADTGIIYLPKSSNSQMLSAEALMIVDADTFDTYPATSDMTAEDSVPTASDESLPESETQPQEAMPDASLPPSDDSMMDSVPAVTENAITESALPQEEPLVDSTNMNINLSTNDVTALSAQDNAVRIIGFHPLRSDVPLGLYIRNGKIMYQGKPAYMSGINFYDPIEYSAATGTYQHDSIIEVFHRMKAAGMGYCRVSFSPYWPNDYKAYARDKAKYYSYMDAFVADAEAEGIGIIPCLFWNSIGTSDYCGEHYTQWGNPSSKTRSFMRQYVKDVVTRFKSSPAIWGWEFSNEMNLMCDLPNAREVLAGTTHPELGTPRSRTSQDYMTTKTMNNAMRAFSTAVRKYDPDRIILSGNAAPRERAYNMYQSKGTSWGKLDTEEELMKILDLQNPGDTITVHLYRNDKRSTSEMSQTRTFANVLSRCAKKLGKPLIIEEFGGNTTEFGASAVNRNVTQVMNAVVRNDIQLSSAWGVFARPDRESEPDFLRNQDLTRSVSQIAAYNALKTFRRGNSTWNETQPAGQPLPPVTIPQRHIINKGSAVTYPKITVGNGGLIRGRDYVINYYNASFPGTATVIIRGCGQYAGVRKATYAVKYALPSIAPISTQQYTGKAIQPTIKLNGLTKDRDYTITYKSNKNVGTATMTITGKGNYAGSKTVTFKIRPARTTVTTISRLTGGFAISWAKQPIQTTGYQLQYAQKSTFAEPTKTITIRNTATTTRKITGLPKNTTYYVRIRTYKTVNGQNHYSTWSPIKSVRTK